MTEKRFILIDGVKKGTHSGIWDNLKQNNQRVGDELWVGEVVAMLNEGIAIVEENVKLKSRNKYLERKIDRERNSYQKQHEKWEKEIQKENEEFKKALVELKEIGDYQEGRIKELNDENEHLESELEKVVEVCRKYGIYKEELQYVLADYDKMLNENGERAIRYKYCDNSR